MQADPGGARLPRTRGLRLYADAPHAKDHAAMFENARELRDQGFALTRQGRWADAVGVLTRLADKEPSDLAARQKLGEALTRVGRLPDAVTVYTGVVRAYAEDGFFLKAMAVCKHILTLEPAHLSTQAMLADLTTRKRGTTQVPVVVEAPAESREESAPLDLPTEAIDLNSADLVEVPVPVKAEKPAVAAWDPERVRITGAPEVVLDVKKVPPIPLFGELTPEEFLDVFAGLDARPMKRGEVLMKEGEPGTSMFVVVQGSVNVQRPARLGGLETVATLRPGAFFGEMALMSNAPRLATVVAAEDGVLLELSRAAVDHIGLKHASFNRVVERFYKTRLLHNVLRASPIFRPLDQETQQQLVEAFVLHSVAAGTDIIREGLMSPGLHILLRGRCEVTARLPAGDIDRFPDMKEGDVFGEISLLMDTQATATVTTVTPCQLIMLPTAAFKRLVRPHPEVARALATLGEKRLARMGLDIALDVSAH